VKLDTPFKSFRAAPLSLDVMVGDVVYEIGAPDGEEFVLSRGVISKILSYAYTNCGKEDKTGTKEQKMFLMDSFTYFGASGGGLFDDRGNLIGVTVRVSAFGPDICGMPYIGQMLLWGHAVSGEAIKAFLEGAK